MNIPLAELLIDIEAQLRQLGQWDKVAPEADALASEQPFCVDTLRLPQWLQFVFVPRLQIVCDSSENCLRAAVSRQWQKNTFAGPAFLAANWWPLW